MKGVRRRFCSFLFLLLAAAGFGGRRTPCLEGQRSTDLGSCVFGRGVPGPRVPVSAYRNGWGMRKKNKNKGSSREEEKNGNPALVESVCVYGTLAWLSYRYDHQPLRPVRPPGAASGMYTNRKQAIQEHSGPLYRGRNVMMARAAKSTHPGQPKTDPPSTAPAIHPELYIPLYIDYIPHVVRHVNGPWARETITQMSGRPASRISTPLGAKSCNGRMWSTWGVSRELRLRSFV